jgi:hypothetical protein
MFKEACCSIFRLVPGTIYVPIYRVSCLRRLGPSTMVLFCRNIRLEEYRQVSIVGAETDIVNRMNLCNDAWAQQKLYGPRPTIA